MPVKHGESTRRGVDEEFFAEVPAGKYKEGDKWEGR